MIISLILLLCVIFFVVDFLNQRVVFAIVRLGNVKYINLIALSVNKRIENGYGWARKYLFSLILSDSIDVLKNRLFVSSVYAQWHKYLNSLS